MLKPTYKVGFLVEVYMANNNYTNKIGIETSEAQRGLKEINASLKDLKASVQYVTVASKDYKF